MEDQLIKENQEPENPSIRQEPVSSAQPTSTPSTDKPISSTPNQPSTPDTPSPSQPAPSPQDTITPNPSTITPNNTGQDLSNNNSLSSSHQTLAQPSDSKPNNPPQQPTYQSAPITTPNQFKRNTAYKLRIGDLSQGEQILDGERFHHLALNNKEVVRVNIIANIIDKFATESERPYGSLTLDDASGQIRLKAFGEDLAKIQSFNMGDTVLVIGLLRLWNNELYLTPEIIKKQDPQYLLVRKFEVDSAQPKQLPPEQRTALKDKLLQQIKDAEAEEGIDIDKVIMELKEKPDTINQEIKKLLEEGLIYEPRPGKLRYLG